uniref:SCP domain-containing protein n=1 Tax=Caenorhabditis japonica TaxID=281687 RepID=A0A8R1DUF2_CAEJA
MITSATIIQLFILVTGNLAQFGPEAQDDIVNAHNALRSSIAKGEYVAKGISEPSAADMLKISWDNSVATSAQNYANTCPTGHSHEEGLGENLFWSWASGSLEPIDQYGEEAASSWEQEFQSYGWTSNILDVATFNTGIGHATQMAWSKTGLVGCGVKDCGPDPSMNNWNQVVVVCQYKEQGNILNAPIYDEGDTCSACPSGTSCEVEAGLCA